MQERYAAVRACKWVDEVVEAAPYTTELEWLDRYRIDFCVHGEDVSVDADGRDSYAGVKEAGRFRYIKRTDSLSTTSLVERLLRAFDIQGGSLPSPVPPAIKSATERSPYTRTITYVPTTYMISLFSNARLPPKGARVVYIDGGFDLFHRGHIEALRRARAHGDYLIVGLYEGAWTRARALPCASVRVCEVVCAAGRDIYAWGCAFVCRRCRARAERTRVPDPDAARACADRAGVPLLRRRTHRCSALVLARAAAGSTW